MLLREIHNKFLDIHKKICKEYKKTGVIYSDQYISGMQETEYEDIKLPIYSKLKLIDGILKFSYETLPILFKLDGHDKNLLLFLMTYCIMDDCTFKWNKLVGEQYADYYSVVTGKRPTYDVIRQSIPALVKANIIQTKEPEKYMLNPILFYGTDRFIKKKLIKAYASLAANRGKKIIDSLFVANDTTNEIKGSK
jgi:hypothetical protein